MKKKTFTGTVGRTMAETNYKYHTVDTDPKNAPNVVYILLDDIIDDMIDDISYIKLRTYLDVNEE